MKCFDYNKIVGNSRLIKYSKIIRKIQFLEQVNELPRNLLVSLFLIESHCRPQYFRFGEYVFFLFEFLANKISRKPVRNLTIGRCQLGIAAIQNYRGQALYNHLEYIRTISFLDFIKIIKCTVTFEHFKILVSRITPIYLRAKKIYPNSYDNMISYIGEQFNGKYVYGILLVKIINLLNLECTYNNEPKISVL